MPRQSRAAIETASLCIDVRQTMPPKPPPELSNRQAAIWRDVVGSLPGDWIARGGYPILIQYCRHVARSRLIEEQIRAFELEGTLAAGGLERWNLLLQMAQRETKFVLDCARMLRLGPHQQIGPRTAGRKLAAQPQFESPWSGANL